MAQEVARLGDLGDSPRDCPPGRLGDVGDSPRDCPPDLAGRLR
jgi:hypothetical protein